jgi:hypothetical protein
VYERDGSRCRFVDGQGNRCTERYRLQFHHRHPFALGGDHRLENVRLFGRARAFPSDGRPRATMLGSPAAWPHPSTISLPDAW